MTKKRKRGSLVISPEKYDLGDFVTKNQQSINAGLTGLNTLGAMTGDETISGATSGLTAGASLGTAIMPGIGTAVGALGGAIFGGIFGGKKKRASKNAAKQKDLARAGLVANQFESDLDVVNENPYGIYADGGEVDQPNIINIEKGELQIDPESGKILREYIGINPETGGLYEAHNDKGEDSRNNHVTADEGTFIITKKLASDYKNSVDNRDKLHQETIMQNIRNKSKRENPLKFAKGGDIKRIVIPDAFGGIQGVTPNINPLIPSDMPSLNTSGFNYKPTEVAPNNTLGNILNTVSDIAPSLYNMVQGSKIPNYQQYRTTSLNPYLRQQTLANMPNEVSVNPVLNSLEGQEFTAGSAIDNSSNNPAIARALRANLASNARRGINEAYINNNSINADIRARRASIYDSLGQQDASRNAQNANMMLGVDETNRRLDLAKEQQFNTGLGQLQEVTRNNESIKTQRRNDKLRLKLLKDMFPASKGYSDEWIKLLGQEFKG